MRASQGADGSNDLLVSGTGDSVIATYGVGSFELVKMLAGNNV